MHNNLLTKTTFGRVVTSHFKPAKGWSNPHLQTLFPKFMLASPVINYVEERVCTPDNDFIDLAWSIPVDPYVLQGIVILFHGLEGSSQSHYIKHLVRTLNSRNLGAVVMHFRGCSGQPNLTAKAYHSGATFDPEFIIPLIKKRFANIPLFAVGFSLGGNMLMKLMAHRRDLPVQASVCVSAPLHLSASSAAVNTGFAKIYQYHLMKSMKANLLLKMQSVDMTKHLRVSPNHIKHMKSFREFDEHITSMLHGFTGADDYYRKASALQDLTFIQKPTLILHAADDPFMNDEVILTQNQINDNIAYELSPHGGHVGFMQSLTGNEPLWLPKRITDFLLEVR